MGLGPALPNRASSPDSSSQPPSLLRPARIHGLGLRRVGEDLVTYLRHRRARGMDVAVSPMPDAVLVIEDVVFHAAVRSRAPCRYQVLHPGLLMSGIGQRVGVGRIV